MVTRAFPPGWYILAGQSPLCRPAAVYQITSDPLEGTDAVPVTLVYCPTAARLLGHRCHWRRTQLSAAWRAGDIRVVPSWSAPEEATLYTALVGHLRRPASAASARHIPRRPGLAARAPLATRH